jgi:uncharacterized protein (DUF885 family)
MSRSFRVRPLHLLVVALALSAACQRAPQSRAGGGGADSAAGETARLNGWLDARYEDELAFSPLDKTELGRKDDYDKIDDFSESGAQAQLEWRRKTVRDLERDFDRSRLTLEGQTSYDLWRDSLARAEARWPFRRRFYTFTQRSGSHTSLPQGLINFHRVDQDADMVAYVTRVGEVAPGQATSYKVGMLKILELRERAQGALGDRFDIRAFHDTVLGGGSLPLSILERRVDAWIAAQRTAS